MRNKWRTIVLFPLLISLFGCMENSNAKREQLVQSLTDSLLGIYQPDSRTAFIEVKTRWNQNQLILTGESAVPDFLPSFRKELDKLSIEFIDSLVTLPQEELGEKIWGLITVSVANLRSGPGHSKELVTQALMGTPVRILKKTGSWFFIQTPDRYLAWVDEAALFDLTETELIRWKEADRIIYLGDYTILHSKETPDAVAVSDLVLGGILMRLGEQGNFLEVCLPDGRSGFISKYNCQDFRSWEKSIQPDPDQMIDHAKGMLGRPYLWGGTSTKGMDCSGFVKTLYFTAGLILPRDASQQVLIGENLPDPLDFNNLQKGDLLFFGRKASDHTKERITHVGFYIGDGKYIHSSGRVKINSLKKLDPDYSQYLVDMLVRAKRVISPLSESNPLAILQHPWYN